MTKENPSRRFQWFIVSALQQLITRNFGRRFRSGNFIARAIQVERHADGRSIARADCEVPTRHRSDGPFLKRTVAGDGKRIVCDGDPGARETARKRK